MKDGAASQRHFHDTNTHTHTHPDTGLCTCEADVQPVSGVCVCVLTVSFYPLDLNMNHSCVSSPDLRCCQLFEPFNFIHYKKRCSV